MELTAEKPGMLRQLDHLAQIARGGALRPCADRQSGRLQSRQVMVIDLVAMAMPLRDAGRAINAIRERCRHDVARLRAQTHRSAEVGRVAAALDRAVAVLPFGD